MGAVTRKAELGENRQCREKKGKKTEVGEDLSHRKQMCHHAKDIQLWGMKLRIPKAAARLKIKIEPRRFTQVAE